MNLIDELSMLGEIRSSLLLGCEILMLLQKHHREVFLQKHHLEGVIFYSYINLSNLFS